ncbi:oligosaccharide flippase family protein [Paraburkholderia sabiae]|uniref:oligosaccharide flippase family protein n=1 Tax=Paraburkholderia sabiae TaxID=273251 RepID=UPI001CC6284E|nr:oligosaccharide flippase family protein [Paraburkholderia sabiae]
MDKAGRSHASLRGGARRTRAPRVGRNLLAMIAWQIDNYLLPLATFPYLTRVLGPSSFGILGYASAIAIYGGLWTDWGFNLSGPRAVVGCRGEKAAINDLIWSVTSAKGVLCLISLLALALAVHIGLIAADAFPIVLMSWLAVLSNVFTLNWVLQGLERFSLFATVSLLGRFATLPLTFIFVKTADDIAVAALIQSSAACVSGALSLVMVRKLGMLGRPRCAWRSAAKRIAEGADMFLSTASVSLFGATNMVILGALCGPYQVGLYVAADRIKTAGNMLPAQINTVLYPRVSTLMLETPKAAARVTTLAACATLGITGFGVVVVSVLSSFVTGKVLGQGFDAAAPVLKVLCFATIFGNLAYLLGLQVLVPFSQAKVRSFVMFSGGLLNIGVSLFTIPRFGAMGAACAFAVAEAVILGTFVLVIVGSPRMRAHFTQITEA